MSCIPVARPRVVLMGIRLPDLSGTECTRRLKGILPKLKVIMLTAVTDSDSVTASLRAGADNYLLNPFEIAQMLTVIRFTLARDAEGTAALDGLAGERRASILTTEERDVMHWLAKGFLYKEIEDLLHLTHSRLRKLQHRIFVKYRVNNRTEATNCWRRDEPFVT